MALEHRRAPTTTTGSATGTATGSAFDASLSCPTEDTAGGVSDPMAPEPYVVQRGDTLWHIAQRRLGSGDKWAGLYADNRQVIGADPNYIEVGWTLMIYSEINAPGRQAGGQPLPLELQMSVDPTTMSLDQINERMLLIDDVVANAEAFNQADMAIILEERRSLDANYRGRVAFDEAAAGNDSVCSPADQLVLPPVLVDGMQGAWDDSILPNGDAQEQGGLIVRNPDGSYEFKRGGAGNTGSFPPNYQDKDADETLVGIGHTHPYSQDEGGYTGVTFSGGDLGAFATDGDRLQVVQSGDVTMVVTVTQEFDAILAGLDQAGKQALNTEINDFWDNEYQSASGNLKQRAEIATRKTCDKYHLLYYRGSGDTVNRVDTSSGP